MSSDKTILVFGATGQQGGAVARALRGKGWAVRALVRDPEAEKARQLAAIGIDLRKGDFSDLRSIENAMSGAYGVFSIQPSSGQGAAYGMTDEQEVRYGKAVADIAAASGVGHLVYTSVGAAGKGETGMGHFDSKTAIEEHIRRLDLPSTIVRPSTFMEMLMLPGMGLEKRTFTFLMREDQPLQMIAASDIGRIVASIFGDPERFVGRTLDISGDELTGRQLQEVFSKAAGNPITYNRFSDSFLDENPFLGRLAALVDDGRCAGSADIPALRSEFGELLTLAQWLSGEGRLLFARALQAADAPVALR